MKEDYKLTNQVNKALRENDALNFELAISDASSEQLVQFVKPNFYYPVIKLEHGLEPKLFSNPFQEMYLNALSDKEKLTLLNIFLEKKDENKFFSTAKSCSSHNLLQFIQQPNINVEEWKYKDYLPIAKIIDREFWALYLEAMDPADRSKAEFFKNNLTALNNALKSDNRIVFDVLIKEVDDETRLRFIQCPLGWHNLTNGNLARNAACLESYLKSFSNDQQRFKAITYRDIMGYTLFYRAIRCKQSVQAIIDTFDDQRKWFLALLPIVAANGTVLHCASGDSLQVILEKLDTDDQRLEALRVEGSFGMLVLYDAIYNADETSEKLPAVLASIDDKSMLLFLFADIMLAKYSKMPKPKATILKQTHDILKNIASEKIQSNYISSKQAQTIINEPNQEKQYTQILRYYLEAVKEGKITCFYLNQEQATSILKVNDSASMSTLLKKYYDAFKLNYNDEKQVIIKKEAIEKENADEKIFFGRGGGTLFKHKTEASQMACKEKKEKLESSEVSVTL